MIAAERVFGWVLLGVAVGLVGVGVASARWGARLAEWEWRLLFRRPVPKSLTKWYSDGLPALLVGVAALLVTIGVLTLLGVGR